jgi:hypothetical protein
VEEWKSGRVETKVPFKFNYQREEMSTLKNVTDKTFQCLAVAIIMLL